MSDLKRKMLIQKATDRQKNEIINQTIDEFNAGKLKSSDGSIITDKDQAIAIALSKAGVSNADKGSHKFKDPVKLPFQKQAERTTIDILNEAIAVLAKLKARY